jgi:hypothetical protein
LLGREARVVQDLSLLEAGTNEIDAKPPITFDVPTCWRDGSRPRVTPKR